MRHLVAYASLVCAACAAPSAPALPLAALQDALARLSATPALAGGRVGVCVVDAATGQELVATAADRGFAPASNLKLVSAAVALHALGPAHRFTTELLERGEVRDGALHGDLVLRGGGDPTLGAGDGAAAVVRHFAAALRERGIQAVDGEVVGDDSWLGSEHLGHGWQWDYLDEDYAAPFGALCWGGNLWRVLVDVHDGAARVGLQPAGVAPVDARIELGAAGSPTALVAHRELGGARLRVAGRLAADARQQVLAVTVPDPAAHAARELAAALRAAGIDIRGVARARAVGPELPIATWASAPLAELVVPLLRDSNNLYAEQVHRAAARVVAGDGSGAAAAAHAAAVLQVLGVDVAGLVLADGSGLSRRDLVQPRQMVRLLQAVERAPWRAAFVAGLPVAGVDGTLRNRFRGTPAAGRVLAKTGTIARVACLSGWVPRAGRPPLLFSVMLNDFTCSDAEARAAMDAFVLQLVAFADA